MDIDASFTDVRISGDLHDVLRHVSLPFMRAIRRSVEEEIERTCPYDSGALLRSTHVMLDERTGGITATADAPYAAAVHDGHTLRNGIFVAPRPYISNALRRFSHGRIG